MHTVSHPLLLYSPSIPLCPPHIHNIFDGPSVSKVRNMSSTPTAGDQGSAGSNEKSEMDWQRHTPQEGHSHPKRYRDANTKRAYSDTREAYNNGVRSAQSSNYGQRGGRDHESSATESYHTHGRGVYSGSGRGSYQGGGSGYSGNGRVSAGREYRSSGNRPSYNGKSQLGCIPRQDFSKLPFTGRVTEILSEIDSGRDISDVKVMTYNILGDKLMKAHANLYARTDTRVLKWDYRFPRILNEIKDNAPDVLCLQEVECFAEFENALQIEGYAGMYQSRTGDKTDGLAFFYKTDKFQLLSHKKVRFRATEEKDALMTRDNVAIVAALQLLKPSGKRVCIATTHLLFNPKRGDVKLGQIAMLFAEIDRIAKSDAVNPIPVVVCGDFNFRPSAQLFKFILDGTITLDTAHNAKMLGMPASQVRALDAEHKSTHAGNKQQRKAAAMRNEPFAFPPPELSHMDMDCRYRDVAQTSTEGMQGVNGQPRTVGGARAQTPKNASPTTFAHQLDLAAAYNTHEANGNEVATTYHMGQKGGVKVDYMFYTQELLTLVERLSCAPSAEVKAFNGLPNLHQPSDHQSLVCRFAINS
ncbi:hypothetical protein SARC_07792 [Sphaeroforma arctica JP610]|uniref:Endonuclease/exonuclease/phosphatase domain-containing protein n=1 Tax=Sphaeroforma arctica JP610 TaxID=667725 RepID=A0A0L0FSP9_9EUKA|nr:hypothetical protein SARC_07792 [Sphaeroforma arctica JP610]KNC79832.1 hypothetical protein SARC_07792 [Sphaeroforma arctica JP610]|eukprot:XP_014153734.1 hypothetical protein SARC_07792 [Sphaeroforma arctica JP610]